MEKTIVLAIMFLSLISIVNALGISSDYYSENPLRMSPGETREIIFGELQNNVGTEDLILRASLIGGNEIAELTDSSEYSVPLNTEGHKVNMRVSIPEKNFQSEYEITVEFTNVAPSEGSGTVPLTLTTEKTIKVIVEEPEKNFSWWWILVIIVIVIAAAYIILRKGRKNQEENLVKKKR